MGFVIFTIIFLSVIVIYPFLTWRDFDTYIVLNDDKHFPIDSVSETLKELSHNGKSVIVFGNLAQIGGQWAVIGSDDSIRLLLKTDSHISAGELGKSMVVHGTILPTPVVNNERPIFVIHATSIEAAKVNK